MSLQIDAAVSHRVGYVRLCTMSVAWKSTRDLTQRQENVCSEQVWRRDALQLVNRHETYIFENVHLHAVPGERVFDFSESWWTKAEEI